MGAVAAGIVVGVAITAAVVACVAATVGICAVAGVGVLVAGVAVAGAASSVVTYGLSTGEKTTQDYVNNALIGGTLGLITGGLGSGLLAPALAAGLRGTAGAGLSTTITAGTRTTTNAATTAAANVCSFTGATVVLMADGAKTLIEDIKVGDKVIATDPETGEQVAKPVTHVWVHNDTVVDLVLEGEVIATTEDHPFWSVTDQRFERADELVAGE